MLFYFKFYGAKLKKNFIKEKFRFCFLKFPPYLNFILRKSVFVFSSNKSFIFSSFILSQTKKSLPQQNKKILVSERFKL